MVLDGETIAAYVAAAATGAGRGTPDRTVESLLDQLLGQVTARVGRGPVDRLAGGPHDQEAMHEVGLLIDGAMSRDRTFAQEMTTIVTELERRGGPGMVDAVSAGHGMPGAAAHGAGVRGGGLPPVGSRPEPTHLVHWSPVAYMPTWAKIFIGIGFAGFFVGLVIFGYTFFTTFAEMDGARIEQEGFPTGFAIGFGACSAGVILAAIGIIGGQMKRRR